MSEASDEKRHDNGIFVCGSYGVLSREQAAAIVRGHTFQHGEYQAVSFYSCHQILGDRFDLLRADPVRGKGPTPDTIYPWNVIDYMIHENPRGDNGKAARTEATAMLNGDTDEIVIIVNGTIHGRYKNRYQCATAFAAMLIRTQAMESVLQEFINEDLPEWMRQKIRNALHC